MAQNDYNAWQFELFGSMLSYQIPCEIYGVYEPFLKYHHCIQKGKWFLTDFNTCNSKGIIIHNIVRKIWMENELYNKETMKTKIIKILPRSIYRRVRLLKHRGLIRECFPLFL